MRSIDTPITTILNKRCLFGLVIVGQALFASAQTGVLDFNQVRAQFRSNGLIGSGTGVGIPGFLVPDVVDHSGPSPLFTAGLWIGGRDEGGQLRVAAEIHEQNGHDFFPGPLTLEGNITSSVSSHYDQLQHGLGTDVYRQDAYFLCLLDPDCDEAQEYPGYAVPGYFLAWPAHGDILAGQAYALAPFFDAQGDGSYDPENGDRPCVMGDEYLYAIYNDKLTMHTESGGQPIGLEVHMMPFAYASSDEALAQTIFVHYRLINRGPHTLNEAYIGLFCDFDLGCPNDDRVQCDVGRNLFFVVNGDDVDLGCSGQPGYGAQPPAFGAMILKGPFLDPDGADNTDTPPVEAFNGSGFGDEVVDNERCGLGHFSYFNGDFSAQGMPEVPIQFYDYLRGKWRDNTPQTYGGTGYSATGGTPARFMFPGDSDPQGVGTDGVPMAPWTEASANTVPGDRMAVGSMGPFTLTPGAEHDLLIAFIYARAGSGGPQTSGELLRERADHVREFAEQLLPYDGTWTPCGQSAPTAITELHHATIRLLPVPVIDELRFELPASFTAGDLMITDNAGRMIQRLHFSARTGVVDVGGLAAGSYVLTAYTPNGRASARFVKP